MWKAVKIGNKYRVVKTDTGKIALNRAGTPLDGGGHDNKAEAMDQVRAIYANTPVADLKNAESRLETTRQKTPAEFKLEREISQRTGMPYKGRR